MTTTDRLSDDTFRIVQSGMDWFRVPFRESVFSLTNGLIGTRGSFEETLDGTASMPMTFMAGLYNTLPGGLAELPVLPDWLVTRITLNGKPFDLRLGRVAEYTCQLDMAAGTLQRAIVWQDLEGRTTRIGFTRFLSLDLRELAVLRIEVAPIDWAGAVAVTSLVTTPQPARGAKASHWQAAQLRATEHGLATLTLRTTQTLRPLAVAVAVCADCECECPAATSTDAVGVTQRFSAEQGATYTLDRFVAFVAGGSQEDFPLDRAVQLAVDARSVGFAATVQRHAAKLRAMWDDIDIEIDGPAEDQRAIRYNLFQLATLCPAPGDFASIGPKGLAGTAYLGHIFWDTEIYMVPFFAMTNPAGARTLLEYRLRTLDGARRKAAENGYRGAQYAWESADTGDETCPKYLTDPVTGEPVRIWTGDLQDHITADVPYAVDYYVRITGDHDFLWQHGAEIYFETARFWADRVSRTEDGRYVVRDTMGPDEFHIHVDNDAFGNHMAHWNLLAAVALYNNPTFPKAHRAALIERINLSGDEPAQWQHIADNLVLHYDEATGLIEQHDGFFERPDISPNLIALPRQCAITDLMGARLAIEGQVLKQAEVVVLQAMFEDRFDLASRTANFDYYAPRTSHDSSLSVSAHAWAAARIDRPQVAYDYLQRALQMDLGDECGNAKAGLHTANMGGVWLAIVSGLAGLRVDGDNLTAEPKLPSAWKRLAFTVQFRGGRYRVECRGNAASMTRL